MNIQQYYRQAANMSLNAGLITFIPVIIFMLLDVFFIPNQKIMFVLLPFLVYSFICYQYYLVNLRRSNESMTMSHETSKKQGHVLEEESLLLEFMPAPSLRMLLFKSDGNLTGEIRDIHYKYYRWFLPYFLDRLLPKRYGLYNESNKLLVEYKFLKERIEIRNYKGHLIGIIEPDDREFKQLIFRKKRVHLETEILTSDVRFKNHKGNIIGKLVLGWMPLEWGKHFKNANTPIITFDETVTNEEKTMILALIARRYRYRNH